MSRAGRTTASAKGCAAGEKTAGVTNEASNECPVCYESFQPVGVRTVLYSFDCSGNRLHGVCQACDKGLFQRHHDTCPICRASRSIMSIAMHGNREPPPQRETAISGLLGVDQGEGLGVETIFFPVVEVESVDTATVMGAFGVHHDNVREMSQEEARAMLGEVMSDAVVQSALQGLRNAGSVTVTEFRRNLEQARAQQGVGGDRGRGSGGSGPSSPELRT